MMHVQGLKYSVPLNPCFVPVVPVQWNRRIRLQAVVFKGFFFNLSMFVPVYQLYNKTTRILKEVNSVNQLGLSPQTRVRQACYFTGTKVQPDNEARKSLILNVFSFSRTTGTVGTSTGTKQNVLDKCSEQVYSCSVFNFLELSMRGTIANVLLTHNGTTKTISEWSVHLGIPYPTIRMRYTRGERESSRLLLPANPYTSSPDRKKVGMKDKRRQVATILSNVLAPSSLQRLEELARQQNSSPLQMAVNILNNVLNQDR